MSDAYCTTTELRLNSPRMKSLRFASMVAVLGAAGAFAQTPEPAKAPEAPKVLPPWELEWAYLSKYHDANNQLGLPARGEKRIVFLGDSITEGWGASDAKFFAGRPYVNRGIGGQTTSQMLVRFRQDVVNLRPSVVVILGGTNDIAQNGGITTLEAIEQNLQSMAELARVNKIRVVLSSVLPAFDYPWRPGLQPAVKIFELNRWIAAYCAKNDLVYLDYYAAVVDGRRGMRAEYSFDGVHPNSAGYAVMEPLAEKAIRRALRW
jgi:lysophospholipase L1-like esterase